MTKETVNLNVNENTGNTSKLEPVRYNFSDALTFMLSPKCFLRNILFTRKDNVQFVIRTTCTIDDWCGGWVKLKSEKSKNYTKSFITRKSFKQADVLQGYTHETSHMSLVIAINTTLLRNHPLY